ncbi:DNA-binding protein [Mycolicibacterium sp. P9-64]|nr:helix-turn-helix domain-containing protein [Mycolicibacterium sp. P9-64]KAA0083685.1 DNA-binding protein [Mycolicibacterium sp. P9-64]
MNTHEKTPTTTADPLPPRPSIQQAAAWLGVDPKTIRRYIAQGRIQAVRIGPRLIRVERESLVALATPVGWTR